MTPGPIDSTSNDIYPTNALIKAYPNPDTVRHIRKTFFSYKKQGHLPKANTGRLKGDLGFFETTMSPSSARFSNL